MSDSGGQKKRTYTASHWGLYEVEKLDDGKVVLVPWNDDPAPSEIGSSWYDVNANAMRVRRPAIREGWLKNGPSARDDCRGQQSFVEVDWDTAIKAVALELERVRTSSGNEGIFGGSYGWASAGRFHHALSQIHRFLNCAGGFVRDSDTYSLGAGRVIMPHILAPMDELMAHHTTWDVMAKHTEIFVAFGGVPAKNTQITPGGASDHRVERGLRDMSTKGVRFVNISPVSDNLDCGDNKEWVKIRPNTDTALMLGLAYVLYCEDLWNRQFIATHCVGFEQFIPYLIGEADGTPKTPEWASRITGIDEQVICSLARDMAAHRTMLNIAWALQRAAHGEQPFWMMTVLAAMLGQIGLPGGGLGVGYGASNTIGSSHPLFAGPTFSQGINPVEAFIPCARITDMLKYPGESFAYNGQTLTYPDIKLVYWAGGNPFHHHQDLRRLSEAWQRPETVIVHEQYWTATAKMADIVLPVSIPLERNDIGYAKREGVMVAMKRAVPAFAESKSDYDIFCAIAERMGILDEFSQGRDELEWLRLIYEGFRSNAGKQFLDMPSFDEFWETGLLDLRRYSEPVVMLYDFRRNPGKHPLKTPSGKIEIHSDTVAGFGYPDCPGHPVWLEPFEWSGSPIAEKWPIHLLTDQPRYRLHSQLDHGSVSRASKIREHEPVYINREDATQREIANGDLIEIINDRGRCIAGAIVTDDVMPGVARLSTGAWYDPGEDERGFLEKHGNPNALTLDRGTSMLAQGCSAQTCMVDLRRYDGDAPPVTAFLMPEFL